MPKLKKPDWTAYEQQVFEPFKEHFPAATIQKDVHIVGGAVENASGALLPSKT